MSFAYKLEGYQEDWRITKDRNIQFENLEPGDYRFNLKSVYMTGMESEPIHFEFTILKPFWRLWWVQLISIVLLIVTIWLILSSRIKTWREKLTLENRLSEIKIDKLQLEKAYLLAEQKAGVMQMNPHFLFNSLNTIKGYYGKGKMKEANGFIGKFSKLLRKILESNKPLIPLQDEAEILTLYLELMRNRYDQVFEYEIINLVEEQLNAKIPPMILQPIVENAVIHGLAPINGGKITVTFEIFEGYLVCKVVDSGVGFSEAVQSLARRYGSNLPERKMSAAQKKVASQRQQLFDLNKQAMSFFTGQLTDRSSGQPARTYLEKRGFNQEIITQFGLGFAPDGGDNLVGFYRKLNIAQTLAINSCMIVPRQNKGDYDRAIEYYGQALAVDIKTFGEEHPDVALSWNNLGNLLANKVDYDHTTE